MVSLFKCFPNDLDILCSFFQQLHALITTTILGSMYKASMGSIKRSLQSSLLPLKSVVVHLWLESLKLQLLTSLCDNPWPNLLVGLVCEVGSAHDITTYLSIKGVKFDMDTFNWLIQSWGVDIEYLLVQLTLCSKVKHSVERSGWNTTMLRSINSTR